MVLDRVALAATLLLALGCEAEAVSLRWRVELDAEAEARAARVQTWISTGACGGSGEVLRRTELGAAEPEEVLLEPGDYAFAARAADAECRWFAFGCVDARLPLAEGAVVVVPVAVAGAEADACDGLACVDGRCAASAMDAGLDGGVDGGPDGGGGLDAGPSRCGEAFAEDDVMPICRASGSVSVDGDLDEYADAVPVIVAAGEATATFRALWDCEHLYVAVEVADSQVFATFTEHDHLELYTTDAVEVFIDVAHDAASASVDTNDHHVIVGATGAVLDARGDGSFFDVTWEMPGLLVATRVLGTLDDELPDTGWIAEMGLPWAELGLASCPTAGTVMGGDLALDDETRSGGTRSSAFADWAGLRIFANPAAWNDYLLLDASGAM